MDNLRLPKKRKFYNPAPVWKRALAFLVDLMIINLIILGPFTTLLGDAQAAPEVMEQYEYFRNNPEIANKLYPVLLVGFALIYLYYALFDYTLGQTPGKMLFNLYLVSEDKKEKLKLTNILLRHISVFPPIAPFYLLWVIDPIYLILKGKRLSDIFSKTDIVEEISA